MLRISLEVTNAMRKKLGRVKKRRGVHDSKSNHLNCSLTFNPHKLLSFRAEGHIDRAQ